MPFIALIPLRQQNDLLPQIQKEMERVWDLGYVYKKTNIRWRHIGLQKDADNKETISNTMYGRKFYWKIEG